MPLIGAELRGKLVRKKMNDIALQVELKDCIRQLEDRVSGCTFCFNYRYGRAEPVKEQVIDVPAFQVVLKCL